MKKNSRVLIRILGGVLLLGILVLGLLAISPVQTAIARRVLADQSDLVGSLGQLKVRPGSIEVSNLVVQQGPLHVTIPLLRAEVAIWDFLGAAPHFDRVDASGWELRWDGSLATTQTEVPYAPAAAGWFPVIATLESGEAPPDDLLAVVSSLLAQSLPASVGELSLKGTAAWRQAGPGADGQAEIEISGVGPTPGQQTELKLSVVALSAPSSSQRIQSLDIRSTITTELSPQGRLLAAAGETTLQAGRHAGHIEDSYGLSFAIDQRSGLPLIRGALSQHERELFRIDLVADASDSVLAGEWAMELSDASIRDLMLGRELPEFALAGEGTVRATGLLDEVNLESDLNFWIVDVAQLEKSLVGVGDLAGQVSFAVRQAQGDTRLTQLDLSVSGAAPVLSARLLQGVEVDASGIELRVADPEAPVFECQLLGLPLSWIQPLIDPWVIDARPIETRIVGLATSQGLRMVTSSPLSIEDAAIARDGEAFVDAMDLEAEFGAELTAEGWQVELGRVEVLSGQTSAINLQARGGRLKRDGDIIKIVGRIDADLAAIGAWPGAEALRGLSQGRLNAEFGIGLEERLSLAAAINVSDLQGTENTDLPDVGLDARVDLRPDGSVELHLPVQITAAERSSELTFNLRGQAEQDEWAVDGSLSGSQIFWQDIEALSEGLGIDDDTVVQISDLQGKSPAGLHAVQANASHPIWEGVSGRIKTALAEIVVADAPALTRLQGDFLIQDNHVAIEDFSLSVGDEGTLEANGAVTFTAQDATPYAAEAVLVLSQVAVDPWLRWFEPGSVPVLEGKVNMTANWRAQSADPRALLVENGVMQARLSSNGGVLRALGVDVEIYVQTGQAVAALGALFGALSGNQEIAKQAQRVQLATNAAEQLALVAFDQLNLNVQRLPNGDVVLDDLSLISPTLRLAGQGRISYRPEVALWLQPLALNLNLAVRGELSAALQGLGLLRSQADALGYLPLITDFSLDGSLANVGTSELQNLIVRSLSER